MGRADQEALEKKIAEGEAREKKEKKAKKKKERKEKANSFFADFKKFITRGNIVDMAIGVIVASAFTAIVTALSNQIIKPLINWIIAAILGAESLDKIYTFLKWVSNPETGEVDLAKSIYIDWGAFINAIINFLIVAFCLFIILRIATKVKKRIDETINAKKIAEEKAAAEEKEAKEKAEAEKKAAEDAAAAEAAAAEAEKKAEAERQFYENVAKQTALLEQIAAGMKK